MPINKETKPKSDTSKSNDFKSAFLFIGWLGFMADQLL